MLLYWIVGVLAAFGGLSLGWVLFGWLLPRASGAIVLCLPGKTEVRRRYAWLRDLGLMKWPLVQPEDDGTNEPYVEICSWQDLPARLELERNQLE